MQRILRFFCCFFLIYCGTGLLFAQQEDKSFSWTLALQNMRTGELVPFSAPVQSWNGEQFRLVVKPGAGCFCYIVAESPSGDVVAVLAADPLKSGETWYSPIMELTAPRGAESLFIVVSQTEQKILAQRISAIGNTSSTLQRRALMNEIFRLRSDVSKFREMPEKPVLMGGAARGAPEKNQGVEFSGMETYVKTISIEH